MNRFNGKHVIETSVADGIHKPGELIDRAVKQDAPVYKGTESSNDENHRESGEGIGATIYKHAMNGVSNMLPLGIGGGKVIALVFLFGVNARVPENPSY